MRLPRSTRCTIRTTYVDSKGEVSSGWSSYPGKWIEHVEDAMDASHLRYKKEILHVDLEETEGY